MATEKFFEIVNLVVNILDGELLTTTERLEVLEIAKAKIEARLTEKKQG